MKVQTTPPKALGCVMCSMAIVPAQSGPSSHSEGCWRGWRVSGPRAAGVYLPASLRLLQSVWSGQSEWWGGGAELLRRVKAERGREVGSIVKENAGKKKGQCGLFAWCFRSCSVK